MEIVVYRKGAANCSLSRDNPTWRLREFQREGLGRLSENDLYRQQNTVPCEFIRLRENDRALGIAAEHALQPCLSGGQVICRRL
jgi:hypothetical protein